ncbi:MAG: N-acetyl-gamma-glutamyl-phosphate reductase [Deltaproteobacteria bacterium]|nr:N-acetyl-gamma-glutamyl-phosphate reductase [Deltaproteobacteria bacterium]
MELARLLSRHPNVSSLRLFSSPRTGPARAQDGGEALDFRMRTGTTLAVEPYAGDALSAAPPDVAFFATPNETSNEVIPGLAREGIRIVDLSGSFRLRDAGLYDRWYGFRHAAPELLQKFVYGLPEENAVAISKSRFIANPGCYATSVLLPLIPLARAGLIDWTAPVICDCKSGVSGAGKTPTATTHFSEVAGSLKAYGVFAHRHLPEIVQESGAGGKVIFTPHLLPIDRGILSTIYLKKTDAEAPAESLRGRISEAYAGAPFIRVLPAGELPQIKWVARTNFCDIGVAVEAGSPWVILVSCIDNLLKGAAGQAVQNMNLMFGLPEVAGLE